MGRPIKPRSKRFENVAKTAFDDKQFAQVEATAEKLGFSLQKYLRVCAMLVTQGVQHDVVSAAELSPLDRGHDNAGLSIKYLSEKDNKQSRNVLHFNRDQCNEFGAILAVAIIKSIGIAKKFKRLHYA